MLNYDDTKFEEASIDVDDIVPFLLAHRHHFWDTNEVYENKS